MATSTKLTPEQRSQRARIAALARWSKEDPTVNAARGQQGLRARFMREIAAEAPGITDAELERRAECRYRQHMASLAFSRSKAKGGGADAA